MIDFGFEFSVFDRLVTFFFNIGDGEVNKYFKDGLYEVECRFRGRRFVYFFVFVGIILFFLG